MPNDAPLVGFRRTARDLHHAGDGSRFSAPFSTSVTPEVAFPGAWRLLANPAVNRAGRDPPLGVGDQPFHPPGDLVRRVIGPQSAFHLRGDGGAIHFAL